MNRNSKKGFTIVELIIVIAVIAVLAAVLIPTFSNLIQKANEAKDTALVSNLNKAVAMDNGSKETVYDVLKVAEDIAGINVAKINAAANSNEILWDSTNKCFVYSVNGEIKYIPDTKTKDVAGDYDYWKLSSNQADIAEGKYSIYWTGAALSEITATTGFDAGDAEIGKIIYQREENATAQTVTIRTNGGELEVSAKPDTVYHYDIASKVVVTKIHNASYHENGTVVGNLEVKEGHVELGAKADVSTVIVAPTTADAAKVTVTTGATVGVVAATTDAGKTYLDSATTVPSDKKAETKLDESVLSQFAGGIGTEASPYLIANAEQFAKIGSFAESMKTGKAYCFKQIDNFVFATSITSFCGIYDGNGMSIDAPNNKSSIAYLFRDAYGNTIIKNLFVKSTENFGLAVYSNYLPAYDSLTIENVTTSVINEDVFKVNNNNFAFFILNYVGDDYADSRNGRQITTIKNCSNYGSVTQEGTCAAAFIGGGFHLTAKNDNHETLVIENCNNYGNVTAAQSAGVLIGNPSYYVDTYEFLSQNTKYQLSDIILVKNVKNYGIISATGTVGVFGENKDSGNLLSQTYTESLVGGTYQFNKILSGEYKVFYTTQGFSVKLGTGADTTATYKVQLAVGTYYMDKENNIFSNGLLFGYAAEIVSDEGELLSTSKIHAYDYNTAKEKGIVTAETKLDYQNINGKKVALYKSGDTLYLIFENATATMFVDSNVTVKLYAYDSNDNYIAGKNINQ